MEFSIVYVFIVILQCFIISIRSQDIPDVTLLVPALEYSYYNLRYETTLQCITKNKSSASAIVSTSWKDSTAKSEFVNTEKSNIDCNLNVEDCRSWTLNNWSHSSSLSTIFDPVTDYRWEEFEQYTTSGVYLFPTSIQIPTGTAISVPISIKGYNNAYIVLCEGPNPFAFACYWIILGGWKYHKKAVIRKCIYGVPSAGYPSGDCKTELDMHEGWKLSETFWQHVILYMNPSTGELSVSVPGKYEPLLQYVDKEMLYITHISFRSAERTTLMWRFHIYNFFSTINHNSWLTSPWFEPRSKELCISFMYHVPSTHESNRLIVTYNDPDGDAIKLLELSPNKRKWNTEQVILSLDTMKQVQISFATLTANESPILDPTDAFSVDRVRECNYKEDARVLKITVAEKDLKSENPPSFTLLQYPDWIITPTVSQKGQTGCAPGMFSTQCDEKCERFLGNKYGLCQNTILCQPTRNGKNKAVSCICSSGFMGDFCQNRCINNMYGPSCSESCGHCNNNYACDSVNGTCPKGCAAGFTTPFCNATLPVLNHAPEISYVSFDRIGLTFHPDDYRGGKPPVSYQIQYKIKQQTNWIRNTNIEILKSGEESVTAVLTGVQASTAYELRIVLYDDESIPYGLNDVPTTFATTTCDDIRITDVYPGTNNITIKYEVNDPMYVCSLSMYKFNVQTGNRSATFIQEFQEASFIITSLEAATMYLVQIISDNLNKSVYREYIITLPKAPEKVKNITAIIRTDSSLTISWDPPIKPNGNITHYKVTYKHIGYKGCLQKRNEQSTGTYTWSKPPIKIPDLIPYSYYEITVSGYTVAEGDPNTNIIETMETDIPEVTPVLIRNNTGSTEVLLQWRDADKCEDQRGTIEKYMVTLQGVSPWAVNYNVQNFTKFRTFTANNLIPYTQYNITIIGMRSSGKTNPKKYLNIILQTQDSALTEVKKLVAYSKGNSWISLRWSPPYPPHGPIEGYELIYYKQRLSSMKKMLQRTGNACKLWDDFICETIENLESNVAYIVEVKAYNMNNKGAQSKSFLADTKEEAPTSPVDLKVETQTSDGSVTVRWQHPDKSNGKLVEFYIYAEATDTWLRQKIFNNSKTIPMKKEIEMEKKFYTYTIEMLQPSTVYELEVAGFTVVKGPSAKVQVETTIGIIDTKRTLEISQSTNTTLTIKLPTPHKFLTNMSAYFVVIASESEKGLEGDSSVFYDSSLKEKIFKKAGVTEFPVYSIVGEIEPKEAEFIIGNNVTPVATKPYGSGYKNHPLQPEIPYLVTVVILNSQRHMITFDAIKIPDEIVLRNSAKFVSQGSNLGLLALLLILLVPVLIFLYMKNRTKILNWKTKSTHSLSVRLQPLQGEEVLIQQKSPIPEPETEEVLPPPQKPLSQRLTRRVAITELENYVAVGLSSGELSRQHALFPRGQTKSWDYGRLPQNKSKNRYGNLVAYDETRVILKKLQDDEYSDYINANYIDGYKDTKFYIATQGPKPNTVDDFWRMVWQEQVHVIAMLANVIENGKKKCEQYWPDLGKEKTYNSVSVLTASTQVFADFTFRQFNITCKNKKRKVMHLHFTSWPDHGVPFYAQSVAEYLKKLLATPRGPGPVLVHCSAGVGRTGTIILCDICLRMAAAEGAVDVLAYLQLLREQRANMVDNLEQYKFVHLVLLECLVEEPACYSCQDLHITVPELRQQGIIQSQFDRIQKLSQRDRTLRRRTLGRELNEPGDKDRFPDIVPGINGRVYLSRVPSEDLDSDYINAISVDGFRSKDQFIATQLPLPSTVGDFWRMVSEKSVPIIVVLNELELHNENLRTCEFWPGPDESLTPAAHLSVRLKQQSHILHWSLSTLQITDSGTTPGPPKQQVVRLIAVNNWKSSSPLPSDTGMLLELWNEIERLYSGKGPIVLTCLDGVTACGLLLALAFVVEKIKLEQQCDVCQAVRTIRQNRDQFITSQEQFEFLYDAAVNYLDTFQTYANFS